MLVCKDEHDETKSDLQYDSTTASIKLDSDIMYIESDMNITTINCNQVHPTVTHIICSFAFWKIAIYAIWLQFCDQMLNIAVPILGAEFFNETNNNNGSDDACNSSSNSTYAFYSSLFASFSGILGLLFQSYIGQVSDMYGRKPVLLFIWSFRLIGYGLTLLVYKINFGIQFFQNYYFWFYLILSSVSNFLNGSFGGLPTILQASVADITPKSLRVSILAYIFGFTAFGLILSIIVSGILKNHYGIFSLIVVFNICMVVAGLYLFFIFDETLSVDDQLKNQIKYQNLTLRNNYNRNWSHYSYTNKMTKMRDSAIANITNITSTNNYNSNSKNKDNDNSKCEDVELQSTSSMISGTIITMTDYKTIEIDNDHGSNCNDKININYKVDNYKCCQYLCCNCNKYTLLRPLLPIFGINSNKVLLNVSLIALFTSLPESGIDDIIKSYSVDVLDLCTDDEANNFASVSTILAAVTLLLCQTVILPLILICMFKLVFFLLLIESFLSCYPET